MPEIEQEEPEPWLQRPAQLLDHVLSQYYGYLMPTDSGLALPKA